MATSTTRRSDAPSSAAVDVGVTLFAAKSYQLERGVTGESFAAHGGRQRLEELAEFVDAGKLRPPIEAVPPLDHAREALRRVSSRHTRGKIVLEIGG